MKTINLVILFILVAGLLLSSCKPANSQLSTGGKQIQLKQIELSSQGGSYELGEAKFIFNPNNLTKPTSINLREIGNPYQADETVVARSNVFLIDGLPLDFQGTLQLSMKIPKTILSELDKKDPASAERVKLVMWSTAYSQTSGGFTYSSRPVDAIVDIAGAVISTTTNLEKITAMSPRVKLASLSRAQNANGDLVPSIGYSIEVEKKSAKYYESDNFRVYVRANISPSSAQSLLTELESARSKIISLGFSFGPFNSGSKFPVYIKDCDYYSGPLPLTGEITQKDGGFIFTWYSSSIEGGSYLEIHPRVVSGDTQRMQAVIGHELMHYAQLVTYFNRPTSVWNDYAMLDEAVAVWFESLATNNDQWLASVASDDSVEFIKTPWFNPASSSQAAVSGYGVSWFIHYLVKEFGSSFILTAYSGGYDNSSQALKNGLSQTYSGAELQKEFLKFLPAYIITTASINPALAELDSLRSLRTPNITLAANPVNNFMLNFKPNKIASHMKLGQVFEGTYLPGYSFTPPPTITLTKELNNLNGFMFSVEADPISTMICPAGNLTISYDNPAEGTGLMVFTLSSKMDFGRAKVVVGPEEAVNGSDSPKINIPGFGDPSCGGTTPQVAILLYNINASEGSNASRSMSVTLTYNLMPGEILAQFNDGVNALIPKDSSLVCANPPEFCVETYNPCPPDPAAGGCAAGQCGMGEGEGISGDYPTCPQKPDYCYSCSPNYCAALLSAGNDSLSDDYFRYNSSFKILLNSDQIVTAMEMQGFSGFMPTLLELKSTRAGSFGSKWSIVWPNCQGKNPGYLIIEGSNNNGWNGTWTIGHDAIGPTLSGTWSESD